MKALVTARMNQSDLDRLVAQGIEVTTSGYGVTGEKLTEEQLILQLTDNDILITEFELVTEKVLSSAKNLKLVACCRNEPGASVDIAYATKVGIPVLYTPGRNAIAVAEYTIGLIISIARNIPFTHHLLRYTDELTAITYGDKAGARKGVTSEWSLEPGAPFQRFQGVELSGKTLGLVGYGAIGQEIANRAKVFGLTIIAFDPFQKESVFVAGGVKSVDLLEVARESDFVVMAAKVTPQTTGMFSKDLFASMKNSAFFINTARAALVDYDALYGVLASNKIAGAALDVYPIEPLPTDSLLRKLDNVILSPHLAGSTDGVMGHHSRMVVDDVLGLLNGTTTARVIDSKALNDFIEKGGLL